MATESSDGPRRRAGRVDSVTLLSLYLILLLALPSRLIVSPLGAAGTPAQILAISIGVWWAFDRIRRAESTAVRVHPVRRTMLCMVVAVLISFLMASLRPMSAAEATSADMGLLALTGWLGVVLTCDDSITSRQRLDVLVRRLVMLGGLVGALGIAQFATHQPFTDLISIPGLSVNNSLDSILNRDGYVRPSGTALHPIEFGVTMSMLLPLALHVALGREHGGPIRRWFPVVTMAVAIPLSISRSAILGTAIALIFILPTWSRSARRVAYLAIAGLVGAVFVAVPGMLGTITNLFSGLSQDASALSRTDSYSLAWEFISRSPLFGRGFMTFLPQYRILDNQYLGLLIDTGVLGAAAVTAVFVVSIITALRRRRRSTDPATRSLAQSLTAAVAAAALSFAFFDAFSFPLLSGLTFLLVGLIGALETTAVETARVGAAARVRRRRPPLYRPDNSTLQSAAPQITTFVTPVAGVGDGHR